MYCSDRLIETIRKMICCIFTESNAQIIINCNMKVNLKSKYIHRQGTKRLLRSKELGCDVELLSSFACLEVAAPGKGGWN